MTSKSVSIYWLLRRFGWRCPWVLAASDSVRFTYVQTKVGTINTSGTTPYSWSPFGMTLHGSTPRVMVSFLLETLKGHITLVGLSVSSPWVRPCCQQGALPAVLVSLWVTAPLLVAVKSFWESMNFPSFLHFLLINCSPLSLDILDFVMTFLFISQVPLSIFWNGLKGKAPNRPILRYSINVSHPCIVIFFINNIWPEFANYSIRARLRFINFTQMDWTVWMKRFFSFI